MAPIDLLQVSVATNLQFVKKKKTHNICKGQQSEGQWSEEVCLYSRCCFHAEIGEAKDLWVWPRSLQVTNIWAFPTAGFSILVFYLFVFGCIGSSLLCTSFPCSEWGLLSVVVRGLLIVVASLAELRLEGTQASVPVVHGLCSCCSEACGIFLDQDSNLCPLHWQPDSYPLLLLCHFSRVRLCATP